MGWDRLENGALLTAAEQGGFDVMVTADQNLRHQQSMVGRQIAIVELSTNHWPTLEQHATRIAEALDRIKQGDFVEVAFPRPRLRRRPPPGPGVS